MCGVLLLLSYLWNLEEQIDGVDVLKSLLQVTKGGHVFMGGSSHCIIMIF